MIHAPRLPRRRISFLILAFTARAVAQSPTPEDINDLLDRVVVDLRIAEKRGPDAQDAFRQAERLLQQALAQDRYHPRARFYEARLLILSNHSQQALRPLQDWIQSPQGENDWEAHYLLGAMYAGGEFYKLARPVLEKALAMNPTEPAILVELSKCEFKLADAAAAERRLREALRLYGDEADPGVHRLLAEILLAAGRSADAEAPAQRAFERASEEARTGPMTPGLLQDLDAGVALLQRVKIARVTQGEKSPQLFRDISSLAVRRGQLAQLTYFHQALSWIQQGLDAAGDPAPEGLLVDAIRVLRALKRDDDAEPFCRRLRELHPTHAEFDELCAGLSAPAGDESAKLPPDNAGDAPPHHDSTPPPAPNP